MVPNNTPDVSYNVALNGCGVSLASPGGEITVNSVWGGHTSVSDGRSLNVLGAYSGSVSLYQSDMYTGSFSGNIEAVDSTIFSYGD